MPLNRLLLPGYRVIATTRTTRTEYPLSDFWTEVFVWCCNHAERGWSNSCEKLTLDYLNKHHFASLSVERFKKCLAQVQEWHNEHGTPYEGFRHDLKALQQLANGDAQGFVVVQEKDYANLGYIIPGFERLEKQVIQQQFIDEE